MGFFSKAELRQVQAPPARRPNCTACGLEKLCQSPKMPVSGKGRRKILVVAEAPGENEDNKGIQLCGKTGQYFERMLRRYGITMREDCWLTNAVICRPPKNNLDPYPHAVDHCRPNLLLTLERLNPEIILLLGGKAIESMMGIVWNPPGEDISSVTRWAGWQIPCQKLNAWICPTYHPSHIERSNDERNPVPELYFCQHLEAMAELKDRPFPEGPPCYENQIKICLNQQDTVRHLIGFLERKKLIAFDYETNMLKPDSESACIMSCAVSDGIETIAFPFCGPPTQVMREILFDKEIPKIAANLKFEERWTRAKLGRGVAGWEWDTMIAGHVLDNRRDINSLDFQCWVHLGQGDYYSHIKPNLKGKTGAGNEENTIQEVDIQRLLKYNGMDALMEYHVAQIQMRSMK